MAKGAPGARVSRLLLFRPDAGGVTPEVVERLRRGFPGWETAELRKKEDFVDRLAERATVVVAGGDGSVSRMVRALAGGRRRLGILPLGTFNNFAHSLEIPDDLDRAIALVHRGHTVPVTLGRANGKPFLELAAVGLFGQAIILGEEAKDLAFGAAGERLAAVAGAGAFQWNVEGDVEAEGRAMSLVFANTPSTGARMPISETRPTVADLRMLIGVGRSRTDIVGRVLASALLDKHADGNVASIRFRRLRLTTRPRVELIVDNKRHGRTPVVIEAEPRALRVFAP
jgi:diacylglycerol kinase family enzyme